MSRVIDLKKFKPPFQKEGETRFTDKVKPVIAVKEPKKEAKADTDKETDKTRILWNGPIFHHGPDIRNIWLLAILLFLIAGLVQFFQGSVITTIFFTLLGIMVLLKGYKKSEVVDFELGPMGVKVGDDLHGYREIKSFWIDYEPTIEIKELSLQLKKWYATYVKIPLYDQNPVQIRKFLLDFIPEKEHHDSLADTLARKFGI